MLHDSQSSIRLFRFRDILCCTILATSEARMSQWQKQIHLRNMHTQRTYRQWDIWFTVYESGNLYWPLERVESWLMSELNPDTGSHLKLILLDPSNALLWEPSHANARHEEANISYLSSEQKMSGILHSKYWPTTEPCLVARSVLTHEQLESDSRILDQFRSSSQV